MLTAQDRPAIVSGALKQFKCENKECPSMVVTKRFESLKTPPEYHTYPPIIDLLKHLMEWYLVTSIPLKSNMSSSDIATHALSNLNDPQQSMVHTRAVADLKQWLLYKK
ncbi:hypothetical protein DSO57_1013375 [Entomophthora muscae]|uniref:Uncharacterized protein n=1 Tax=Entomophthora muscae TaxID=34485 RepID=A0ACC2RKI5_9FUNG|nr:hypothetical protein DSO57_1013375 [Entomophthora muscae]